MSARELFDIYRQMERDGVRNINCGHLRRIGKTTCLKELIMDYKPMDMIPIVLVPNRDIGREYNNICRAISVSDLDEFRGFISPCCVYADEVPNAEEIVYNLRRTNITFVAGFYSIPVFPPTSNTARAVRPFLRSSTNPRFIEQEDNYISSLVEQEISPTRLESLAINQLFSKPAKHIKTKIKVVNKNLKMKFIRRKFKGGLT